MTRPRRRWLPALAVASLATSAVIGACTADAVSPGTTGSPGTTSATSAAAAPTVRGYAFPPGMLKVGDVDTFTPMDGVLALPSTPGPHPLAVIVHGSYPNCIDATKDKLFESPIVNTTPWPQGCTTKREEISEGYTVGPDYVRATASLGYLAQDLARRGIAAVAVDVSSKERMAWSRDVPSAELHTTIVKAHLAMLAKLNAGESLGLPWGDSVRGKLDLGRLAVIGHSTGGAYAAQAASRALLPNLKAAVALQPASEVLTNLAPTMPPLLVVTGQCDEQVQEEGLDLAKDLAARFPRSPLVSASMAGTTHIGLLSGGGSHRVGLVTPVETPGCKDGALLPAAQRQGTVSTLTGDFLTAALAGTTAYELGVAPGAKVTLKSWTSAATVRATPAAVPPFLPANGIHFDTSTFPLLPAKPASLDINTEADWSGLGS